MKVKELPPISEFGLSGSSGLTLTTTLTPPKKADVEVCRRWIRLFVKRSIPINRRFTSYELKHEVEAWSHRDGDYALAPIRRKYRGSPVYVPNGAFIQAALLEGYRAVAVGETPNAKFNMKLLYEARTNWHPALCKE